MKALLDTNIVIHRETHKVINQDIGILFKWLDKAKYEKCIHPITIDEINRNTNRSTVESFSIKMDSYEILRTTAPISEKLLGVSKKWDVTPNDANDSVLLNEILNDRVDILISEDKKIHKKAHELGVSERVYTINSFLEKIYIENPELVEYKILSVQQLYFGQINLRDSFFDSLRADYQGFDLWFNRKANEKAYVTLNKDNNRLLSFLYIKKEDRNEPYNKIDPPFTPKSRLKVGTFKIVSNGVRLGERFLRIIFENALNQGVEEIYLTIYDRQPEQLRLISLIEEWGFAYYGKNTESGELVYVRYFLPRFIQENPKLSYPFISLNQKIYLVPIYPAYHTELIPDSILRTESRIDFLDDEPHRNAIRKVYISGSTDRNVKKGDIMVFYRTGGYYKSVVTTVALVDNVYHNFQSVEEFIKLSQKRSVFTDEKLIEQWDKNVHNRPFLVNFLYIYSFPNRINLKRLIEIGVLKDIEDAPRGFKQISNEKFYKILTDTNSNASFIVD